MIWEVDDVVKFYHERDWNQPGRLHQKILALLKLEIKENESCLLLIGWTTPVLKVPRWITFDDSGSEILDVDRISESAIVSSVVRLYI